MDFKRYLPHLAALGIFLTLLIVFFKPIVFDRKQIRQSDIEGYVGMTKEINDYRKAHPDDEPLWTNSMFGGMPAYQINVEYPTNGVMKVQRAIVAVFTSPITIFLINMVGFYFLLLVFGVKQPASVVGAIAFGFSSYMAIILGAGHNSKAFAIAYMAPVVIGFILTMRGKLLLGGAITAVALAFELNANHLQITYYLLLTIILLGIGEAIRLTAEGKGPYIPKAGAVLLIAVFLGVLPNYAGIMLTESYSKYTTRGPSELTIDSEGNNKTSGLPIDYATQWSYGIGETFTLLIPDFNGGASDPIFMYDKAALKKLDDQYKENIGNERAYFGSQSVTSGPVYVGALICFLFLLGMFIVKDSIKWWLLAATVLSIVLSWGRNTPMITEFVFHYIPGYNKFRAVSMILVIAQFTMPLMAFLTVRELINNPDELRKRLTPFWISLGVTAGIAFLVAVTPTSFVDTITDSDNYRFSEAVKQGRATQNDISIYSEQLSAAREYIVSSDAWRSFFVILIGALFIFGYVRQWYKFYPMVIGIGLVITLDLFTVSLRYLDNQSGKDNYNYEKRPKGEITFAPTAADEAILQDKDPSYRVMNVATPNNWQESRTAYFHKSIGGYHGAKLKRIQELYEQGLQNEIGMIGANLNKNSAAEPQLSDSMRQVLMSTQTRINMLNGRYIIYRVGDDQLVLRNSHACGNAWFVPSFTIVANADSEIVALKRINPKQTAVIDKRFEGQLKGLNIRRDSTAEIKLVSYAPNKLKYDVKTNSDQLAIFSEVYYPDGWKAFVDGKEAEYMRANYVLRAIRVPAGTKNIEFRFEPSQYSTGLTIAGIGSVLLFAALAGAIYWEWRSKKKEAATKAA